jgi:FdhD protein
MTTAPFATDLSPVEPRAGEQWRVAGASTAVLRDLPEETPVGIAYDGKPHAVLMASPGDFEDLAVGFTLSEGIARTGDIEAVTVEVRPEGVLADVALSAEGRRGRARARVRTMEGRSSCGLCGVQRLSAAVRPLARVAGGDRIGRGAIQAALAALDQAQTLGRLTRAMHAAAWAGADGTLALVREDVGRHNALDKLIGAGARAGLDAAGGFVVVTSRCSYEMVEKAATADFPLLVAISAPTALAIRKAEEAGMTLVALARADGHTVFTRPDRLAP